VSGVLVVAESRGGELRDISLELLGTALDLESEGAGAVTALVVGPDANRHSGELAREGVHELITVGTPREHVDAWTMEKALDAVLNEVDPAVILVGHTTDGQGFAPAVAARRGLGFASNVTSAHWTDDALVAERGMYSDHLVATLAFDRAALLMQRVGSHEPATAAPTDVGVRSLTVPFETDPPTEHIEFVEPDTGDVDITEAEFILSIGRGIEDRESIDELKEVADALGATLAASRPLVDAGWMPSSLQVGQSGRTVKPKVYLALGISGAVQHLAGIRDAETVIAVNTDPRAPIFNVAHYGAVADLFDVAAALPRHFQ
jgi:electron transfer flavoprotein alpha subunit